ncbi:MAG: DUF1329 domain-containing protein, partial [Candidatus Binatia bacterium]
VLTLAAFAAGPEADTNPQRTWRTVAELTDTERALVDKRTATPRDSRFPYIPAERYPFEPPYTAEEMGYRAMEFSHSPRWSCNLIDVSGALTSEGYLLAAKLYSPIFYVPNAKGLSGFAGELYGTDPGEPTRQITGQDAFPPEAQGNQMVIIQYRTDQEHTTRWDMYLYTEGLRRVRRQPSPRRGDKLAEGAEGLDDIFGRDPWEFDWELLGTDVLSETVRFPNTRPTVTLARPDGTFSTVPSKSLRMMGEKYPSYTPEGGVKCWVVKARAKKDWLPGYYAPTIIYWLDQHYFYPLRVEQYDKDGNLIFIETRLSALLNPAMGDKGYGMLFNHYWDVTLDYMRYSVHDAHEVRKWSKRDQEVFFNPAILPRKWYFAPLKSQVEVTTPEQFFLRPTLDRDKFPQERKIVLPPELEARIQAQEAAGHLRFGE